ncbi:MAG: Asp-tRNA(Asn)/Glu-tRNA(Gln) amidotransferase subunit GatC [Chitinispirillales bacterium]|jgi:aspartyl-tRNA(Asn)/glutamyl-tRNA(Gln) amidotransferase subunit C|nr:Asp-tRNA(Asn)/Glu-tRNA(Gln) amidotransferase subunit GatC [Chitinispirillales bacterium]
MITKEDTQRIASVAKIKLSDEETEKITAQLGSILKYAGQLKEVDTGDAEPAFSVVVLRDSLREDVEAVSLSPEEALANGPSVKKGHFAIPKIIG